jgi:hypothetical protein
MADDLSPQDRDLIARTMLSEAGQDGPAGMAAVASVIKNRVESGQYGASPSDVVLQPRAFSAWDLPRNDPNNPSRWSTKNPQYQQATTLADSVWSGDTPDPTGGADHYLNPAIVKAQRGTLPDWAQGKPTAQIGGHAFYASTPRALAFDEPSQSDINETAGMFGIKPVTAPTGITAPTVAPAPFASNVTPDDLAATAKALGLGPTPKGGGAPVAATLPGQTNTGIVGAAPGKIPQVQEGPVVPTQQEAALAQARGLPMQAVGALPLAGPAINATTAALQASTQPGGSWYDRFTAQLDAQRRADQYFSEQNPATSALAQFGGSGAGYGALSLTGLGRLALGASSTLPWGTRIYTGAFGGGAIGGLDAALRGENPIQGAEIGAAGGVAGPILGGMARSGTNAVANYAWPRPGVLADVPRAGINLLTGAMEGETPATIAAARARMGTAGFFADLTPGTTDIAGGIADLPGPGKAIVRGAYNDRAAAQGQRIDAALTNAMGPNFNVVDYQRFLTEARAAAADPLYEQWRSMQVHPTDALKTMIPRLDAAGAFDQAEKLAAINGDSINRNFFTTGPQKAYPTTQTWDYVKRALDSKIDQAYGANDKTTAASLIKLKNQMIGEIGNTNAGQIWNQARGEFADRSALIDQISAGRDTFIGGRSGLTPDEMAEELKGLSGPELMARIYGARTAAADAMGDTVNGDTTLRNKLLTTNNQQKLRMLLQDDQKSDSLISTLQSERYLGNQQQNVVGGSQTTPKKERTALFSPPQLPSWRLNLTEPMSLLPPSAQPHNVVQSIINDQYAKAAPALAPIMTTPQGPQMDALISSLMQERERMAAVNRYSSGGANLLSGLIAGPGQETYRERALR